MSPYVAPAKGLASGGKKSGKPRVIPLVYKLPAQNYGPWTPQQTIDFVGSLTDGTKSTFFSFNVLAGASAPTITGGWGENRDGRPAPVARIHRHAGL